MDKPFGGIPLPPVGYRSTTFCSFESPVSNTAAPSRGEITGGGAGGYRAGRRAYEPGTSAPVVLAPKRPLPDRLPLARSTGYKAPAFGPSGEFPPSRQAITTYFAAMRWRFRKRDVENRITLILALLFIMTGRSCQSLIWYRENAPEPLLRRYDYIKWL